MNKIKIFHSESSYTCLEDIVNEFAKNYKILNTSISTATRGYTMQYTIAVLYGE